MGTTERDMAEAMGKGVEWPETISPDEFDDGQLGVEKDVVERVHAVLREVSPNAMHKRGVAARTGLEMKHVTAALVILARRKAVECREVYDGAERRVYVRTVQSAYDENAGTGGARSP